MQRSLFKKRKTFSYLSRSLRSLFPLLQWIISLLPETSTTEPSLPVHSSFPLLSLSIAMSKIPNWTKTLERAVNFSRNCSLTSYVDFAQASRASLSSRYLLEMKGLSLLLLLLLLPLLILLIPPCIIKTLPISILTVGMLHILVIMSSLFSSYV